jgi:DNA-binding NarL/FixJ family response regulator
VEEVQDEQGPEIRVVVADDHPMLRQAISIMCETDPGITIVGQAADGEEALTTVLELEPDVLILDLMLPKMDGFQVAREIRKAGLPVRILVVTGRDDSKAVLESMRAAVDGFLDKTSAMETIAEAVRSIAAGERLFSPDQEKRAIVEFGNFVKKARETSRVHNALTDRETEVLQLISLGLTTRQMASRLQVSQRTVESHIKNLYRKLEVRTRVQAVARGEEFGLFAVE